MEKLNLHSPDFTQANIAKLAELFPNCVTESRESDGSLKKAIDFDLLKQELSTSIVEGPQERYQLNWPGKREALLTANAPIAKTLRPCRAESVDFDTTQNLYIEGDNLDALKLLQETYLGKVKMIYIDPPYNTGNDFIYEDDFAENSEAYFERSNQKDEVGNRLVANNESNGRFHSDWLSMMYSRLKLARNLLRDDGVVFISIDDNEQANLKRLCDEVFGEDNFVGVFPWRSRTAKADVPFGVSCDVEWVLAFARSSGFIAGRAGERKYFKSDDYDDRWRLQDLTKNTTKHERPNSFFTMVNPRNGDEFEASETRTWSVTLDTFMGYYKSGKIVFPNDYDFLNIKRPAFRVFEKEDQEKAMQKYGSDEVRMSVSTYLPEKELGRTENGTKEIRQIFDKPVFPYPKPLNFIKYFIQNISDSEALILDFFSGSCTTAHAVMQLNAEDGGNRKFIMVQLPEACDPKSEAYKAGYQTIVEIGKERIRRAGLKIKTDNTDKAGIEQLDIGFRVLKVDSSNMKDVYYTPDHLDQKDLFTLVDNIREGRSAEDLLFQVLLDWGVDLTLLITEETIAGFKVLFVDENALAACFDTDINETFIKELAARHPLRVVFRDASFANDSVKINIEQIFKLISPHTEIKTL